MISTIGNLTIYLNYHPPTISKANSISFFHLPPGELPLLVAKKPMGNLWGEGLQPLRCILSLKKPNSSSSSLFFMKEYWMDTPTPKCQITPLTPSHQNFLQLITMNRYSVHELFCKRGVHLYGVYTSHTIKTNIYIYTHGYVYMFLCCVLAVPPMVWCPSSSSTSSSSSSSSSSRSSSSSSSST